MNRRKKRICLLFTWKDFVTKILISGKFLPFPPLPNGSLNKDFPHSLGHCPNSNWILPALKRALRGTFLRPYVTILKDKKSFSKKVPQTIPQTGKAKIRFIFLIKISLLPSDAHIFWKSAFEKKLLGQCGWLRNDKCWCFFSFFSCGPL